MNFVEPSRKEHKKFGLVFLLFILWTFVIIGRPQDIFTFLQPLRPAILSSALVLCATLFSGALFRGPSIFAEQQVKLYLALLMVMVMSIPFSLYARLSFMHVFTVYILIAFYFFIFYSLVDSISKLSFLLFVVCLCSGFYSTFSVKTGSMANGRLFFAEMFDPNDLAFFTLSFLPFNLLFISRNNPIWKRCICLAFYAVGVMLIVLTGSRGGLLTFGVVGLLLLFRKTRTITFSLKAITVVFALVILSMSSINLERYSTLFTLKEDYNFQGEDGRLALWSIGMQAILSNPLTGVGVMCFPNAIGLDRAARGTVSQAWLTAHNSAVQIGTETGVIGLLLYLWMSFNVLRIFIKVSKESVSDDLVKISEMGFAGFTGLFVSGMFLSQAYSINWAFYVAFSAVTNQLHSSQRFLQSK